MAHFFPSGSRLDTERTPPGVRRATSRRTKSTDALASSSSEHHYSGPSRINWLNAAPSSPSTPTAPRRPPSAHVLGRSASLSALVGSPPPMYRHNSLASNLSLQLDMLTDPRPLPVDGNPALLHVKPLSPIFEQALYHVDGRLPGQADGAEPQTPASYGDYGSTYSAFLRRPLKRSISQASTSSLRTVGTASMAPTLPPLNLSPLDLRPSCPTAHRSGPQLFSTVYEDANSERTGSFVTARSVGDDQEDATSLAPAADEAGEGSRTLASSSTLPPAIHDSARLAPPTEPDSAITLTQATPRPRPRNPAATTDSFIWRRWQKGISFGSTRPRFSLLIPSYMFKKRASLPAFLFWAGFVAPWCWLIGGWLVAEGRLDEKGNGPLLPVFKVHVDAAHGKEKAPASEKGKGKKRTADEERGGISRTDVLATEPQTQRARWWTQWRPSNRAVAVRDPQTRAPENVATTTNKRSPSKRSAQAWVVRCRVAAVASGALLVVAFVVSLVIVGGSK